tara:strand:+ start:795 stop:1925 length:1131 start_codon:yes stop_codon:yes gene_type:complete
MKIRATKAFKVLDSQANPTIAVAVKYKKKYFVSAAPSGTSVGKKEAEPYRKNVDTSVKYFNSRIAPTLRGFKFKRFEDFEKLEKKTMNLYANPTIALEYSLLKALASAQRREIYTLLNPKAKKFPKPLGKAIGGGAHAGVGDVQEYLFAPDKKTFTEAVLTNAEIYKHLEKKLKPIGRDAEGGWVTSLPVKDILKLCLEAKQKFNVELGIDLAASQLFRKSKYHWNKKVFTKKQHLDLIANLMRDYQLDYVEDPFEETDLASFAELASVMLRKSICADDITCTNPSILREVVKRRAATAVIVKPNQIGSLIKTKEFVDLAKGFGLKVVVSHRSGSTTDVVLSHLALGWEADYFKCGIAGGERVGKINELIRLEHAL